MTVEKLLRFLNKMPANAKVKVCNADYNIETESEDVLEVYLLQSACSEEANVIIVG